MKVINLFNRIANEEEVPKKIQVYNDIFVLDEENKLYEHENTRTNLFSIYNGNILNYEVEVIEENKKIEKLETYKEIDDEEHYANILKVSKNGEYEIDEALSVVVDKINEIIDKINSMEVK